MYYMSKTYATWSKEAIDAGATDDMGFIYNGQKFDTLEDMADEVLSEGNIELSQFPVSERSVRGLWYYTSDGQINYKTGETTKYAFHPELCTDDAMALYMILKSRFEVR